MWSPIHIEESQCYQLMKRTPIMPITKLAILLGLLVSAPLLIASEPVDRTKVAQAGAVHVLLTQTIEQHAAVEAIDWTIFG